MNPWLILVLAIIFVDFLLETLVERLNLRHMSPTLPGEFADVFDDAKYATAQEYQRTNARFGMLQRLVMTPLLVAFIVVGGFSQVDLLARQAGLGTVGTGLVFAAVLGLGMHLLSLPFTLYDTFVIEARYGFNQTTPRTFVLDQFKGLLLAALLGGGLFAAIVWFFASIDYAWLWVWGLVMAVQFLLLYLGPILIMPLFNTFTPLPAGELRDAIERYARAQGFQLSGIFTMDGSRRSAKANAFFTGIGRHRRIVLYDTLVEKHTTDELVAILAHEMGHFRLGHIHKLMGIGILSTGLMFYVFSRLLGHPGLFAAFGFPAERISVYAGLFLVGFLYAPVSSLLGIVTNALSRRFEYQADAYAARTHGQPEAMILALKQLSADNLSNLTPHPAKVILDYSHPPVLARIRALRA